MNIAESNTFELTPWQKRQAAIIQYYTDVARLHELLERIEGFMFLPEPVEMMQPEEFAPHDVSALTIEAPRMNGDSAIVAFRKSVLVRIHKVQQDKYGSVASHQCAKLLEEFAPPSLWPTIEEGQKFHEDFERQVLQFAGSINAYLDRYRCHGDAYFDSRWQDVVALKEFEQLPRFRVRTDVVAESGQPVPRTGLYVPQDDPLGVVQLAWTGDQDGQLAPCVTFSDYALQALQFVGIGSLWTAQKDIFYFVQQSQFQDTLQVDPITCERVTTAEEACRVLMDHAEAERPCQWYFVECVDDELEHRDHHYRGSPNERAYWDAKLRADVGGGRALGGQACPRSGYWHVPARAYSRRFFQQGQIMPMIFTDVGTAIWLWDEPQQEGKVEVNH